MSNSLLNAVALEKSEIVANASMNRQRNLRGKGSYEKELGVDPVVFLMKRLERQQDVAWLDVCCGTGRALIQAATILRKAEVDHKSRLIGIDLVPLFDPIPSGIGCLRLEAAAIRLWSPTMRFDLITCVHGLHYIGDKLGLVQRAAKWLDRGGLLLAHLDYGNLRIIDRSSARFQIGRDLRRAGFRYQSRRHLLTSQGLRGPALRYEYLGADVQAGKNYTGQPSVDSYYKKLSLRSPRTRRSFGGKSSV